MNRRITNNSKFLQIINEKLWNSDILKECKTAIYKIYFKMTLTSNSTNRPLKKKQIKIQATL
jgi:hypothetical protein